MVEIAFRYFSYQRHYGAYAVREEISTRRPGPVIGAVLLAAAALIGAVVTL
jgi:hypothetical protein